jgi:hypothetical protein
MQTIDNSLSSKMDMEELLRLMEWIATSLVTSLFITDFTVYDTGFIRRTNASEPFIWLVRENGTHLYVTNSAQEIRNFFQTLDYYENHSDSDFCLYRYDGEKLFPVFPKITRILTKSYLINLSSKN